MFENLSGTAAKLPLLSSIDISLLGSMFTNSAQAENYLREEPAFDQKFTIVDSSEHLNPLWPERAGQHGLYDSNHDHRIDANDAVYNQLRIWHDFNGDGSAGDLKTFNLKMQHSRMDASVMAAALAENVSRVHFRLVPV